MNIFDEAKKVLRRERELNNKLVRDACSNLYSKTSGLVYDISNGERGKKINTNKRAYIKALELVSSLLSEFSLPFKPTLEYHGIVKNASDNLDSNTINDGFVRIGASFMTLTGHKIRIDIPVIIKNGSLVEPAVFFYHDAPYVMCGPALDDLIRRGSTDRIVQPRKIFSPPLQYTYNPNSMPREVITNQQHMFSPGPRNPMMFRRQYSKEPRKRTNIDVETAMPELWIGDVQDEMLDPSERRIDKLFNIGDNLTLKQDVEVRNRGGGNIVLPKGESGIVLRSECDGKMLYINFDKLDITAYVPKRMFKNASFIIKKVSQTSAPDYIDSTFLIIIGPNNYSIGARGNNGVVYYENNTWNQMVSNLDSLDLAEKLNNDGWIPSIAIDELPIKDSVVSWHKSAATTDQIKNEIDEMLREGYQKVDIKDMLNNKYPEQANKIMQEL